MTIIQIKKLFNKKKDCIEHLEKLLWNGEPICPYCNSKRITDMPNEQRYHCNNCNMSFSVTTRTIFHKTKLDLWKWFVAISLVSKERKKISARQMAKEIDVTKDTALFMLNKIRRAFTEQNELMRKFFD